MHPHEHRLTRRNLMRGALGVGAAAGVAGVAAGCANTTTEIGGGEGAGNAAVNRFVVAKPTGPLGLPLPRTDNSVAWAITEDNPPIKDGLKPEGGTLKIFNYADYIGPGWSRASRSSSTVSVQDRDVQLLRRGDREALLRRGRLRRAHRPHGADIVQLMAKQILQPLNHTYLPNLDKNIWPELRTPFYDRGSPLHGAVRRLAGRDRLAQRQDRQGHRGDGRPLGHLLAVPAWKGKVGMLDDKRDGLSMPMQRDAMPDGAAPT